MKFSTFLPSGKKTSVICLGTMNWGQQNTESEAHEQLDYATTHGVNFIDTAEMYPVPLDPAKQGTTERFIGTWLKKRGKRDDLIIASKVDSSEVIRTRPNPGKTRYDRANIMAAIDGTLERLQTEYVDLYQVHRPERTTNFFGVRGYQHNPDEQPTPIAETLEVLSEVVRSGKARAIGISNETPWGVAEYVRVAREKGLERIVSIQNQYSLLNRTFEIGLAEMSIRENVPLLAYSALNMGVLSGKYLGGAEPAGARFTLYERNRARYNPPQAQVAIEKYVAIAKKNGLDPAQMALAYVHARPFLAATIIGTTSVEQLKSNIDSIDIVLSPEILAEIEAVYQAIPDPTC